MKSKTIKGLLVGLVLSVGIGYGKTLPEIRDEYQKTNWQFRIRLIRQYTLEELTMICDAWFKDCKEMGYQRANRMYQTNNFHRVPDLIYHNRTKYAPELRTRYDEALGKLGLELGIIYYGRLPKTMERALTEGHLKAWAEVHPYLISRIRNAKSGYPRDFTLPEQINVIYEECAKAILKANKHSHYMYNKSPFFSDRKKSIMNTERLTKEVKRSLRTKGMSFVVDKGKNPLVLPVQELVVCLDAPKMAGVKEWVAKWFPDHEWVDTKWPSEEEINTLKNSILEKKKPLSLENRFILESYLGVDGFNGFIDEYNATRRSARGHRGIGKTKVPRMREYKKVAVPKEKEWKNWYENPTIPPYSRIWWICKQAQDRAAKGESVDDLYEIYLRAIEKYSKEK